MLQIKRTCKNTSHSSIPPCNVGPFPRTYGIFPSDFKGSIITNKYVLSTLCALCAVPITREGNEGALFLWKGLSQWEINLPLTFIAWIHLDIYPSTLTWKTFTHLNTMLANKQASGHLVIGETDKESRCWRPSNKRSMCRKGLRRGPAEAAFGYYL